MFCIVRNSFVLLVLGLPGIATVLSEPTALLYTDVDCNPGSGFNTDSQQWSLPIKTKNYGRCWSNEKDGNEENDGARRRSIRVDPTPAGPEYICLYAYLDGNCKEKKYATLQIQTSSEKPLCWTFDHSPMPAKRASSYVYSGYWLEKGTCKSSTLDPIFVDKKDVPA